jgi:cell division protein FtsN
MAEVYAAAEIPTSIPAGPRRMDRSTMLALREQRENAAPPIQVAQLPPGPVTRMETVDSAPPAAYSPPIQVASLPSGPVVRMDPIPDGSTGVILPPEPASRSAIGAAPALAPPVGRNGRAPAAAPPARGGRGQPPAVQTARGSRSAAPTQTAARGGRGGTQLAAGAAPARPAASPFLSAANAPRSGFTLIPSAQAGTLPRGAAAGSAGGGWGVQVGAFASENLARASANSARDQIATLGSRSVVQPVGTGNQRLYRARVTGLSETQARAACARARGGCAVLTPGALN